MGSIDAAVQSTLGHHYGAVYDKFKAIFPNFEQLTPEGKYKAMRHIVEETDAAKKVEDFSPAARKAIDCIISLHFALLRPMASYWRR